VRTGRLLTESTIPDTVLIQCDLFMMSTVLLETCAGFELLLLLLLTGIGLSPDGSGYFTCIQNMKLVTSKFKSGGLHEKHVVATWNVGNRLSVCLWTQGNQEKPVSRWPVAGTSGY